jgi:D-glycero-alpha-D-manno-heptose-7-phosphate kinase
MIITRSPLRISLGGGGTDLPSYYREHSGFLIAAAIDKYVYITLHQTFDPEIILKYSKMERRRKIEEIEHPLIREALRVTNIEDPHIEITSMADIPSGTGLGSSGSFTTALLRALHAYKHESIRPGELAEEACDIEINRLKEPVGKQDQYIAAYGGLTCFRFLPDDKVEARPLKVSKQLLHDLEDNLLLFFTGYTRSASTILKDQHEKSLKSDKQMIDQLHFIKELGKQSLAALESANLPEFARLMDVHWQEKHKRSGGMSNSQIDDCYIYAMKHGALGGKLIGAGGGGFLMFYTEERTRLRKAMAEKGLQEVRFRFDFDGTKVLVSD